MHWFRSRLGLTVTRKTSVGGISLDTRVLRSPRSQRFDGIVRVWDRGTHELVKELEPLGNTIGQVAFSPDGSKLAVCWGDVNAIEDTGGCRTWDVGTWEHHLPWIERGAEVITCQFTSDGKRLITAMGTASVNVRDASSGALIATLPTISCLLFPNSDILIPHPKPILQLCLTILEAL